MLLIARDMIAFGVLVLFSLSLMVWADALSQVG